MLLLPGGSQDSPTHGDRKKNGSCQEHGKKTGGKCRFAEYRVLETPGADGCTAMGRHREAMSYI